MGKQQKTLDTVCFFGAERASRISTIVSKELRSIDVPFNFSDCPHWKRGIVHNRTRKDFRTLAYNIYDVRAKGVRSINSELGLDPQASTRLGAESFYGITDNPGKYPSKQEGEPLKSAAWHRGSGTKTGT